MEATDRLRRQRLGRWLALLAVFALEFWLFDRFGSRRHTWIYPRWNDQIQYLTEAYTDWGFAVDHGFLPGLWHAIAAPTVQGSLHGFLALPVFALAGGPSRSAALAVNILAVIAWQAAFFLAARRRTGSDAMAVIAAALPLALAGPWSDRPGSAIDFRLDHLAMCALGVAVAAAWLSDRFRSLGGALCFGAAVGAAVLGRFLTAVYLAPIFVGFLLWTAAGPDRALRLRHGLLAASLALAMAVPFLVQRRELILDYYWIGHSTGPEAAIRNVHLNWVPSLEWVAGCLAQGHLGSVFGWILGGGTVALAAASGLCWRKTDPASSPFRRGEAGRLAVIGLLFVLLPGLVLAWHEQKSFVVVGALAPGAVALVVAAWSALAARTSARWRGLCAAAVAAASFGFFAVRQFAPAYDEAFAAEARTVNRLADLIYTRSRQAGLARPSVGVDYVTDALDAQVLRVLCYERHRVWTPFIMTLPTGITAEKESLLLERAGQSDFLFLTEEGPAGGYPFDQEMAGLRPRTSAWAEAHLRPAARFRLLGRRMVLYQRREIPFPP